MQIGCSSEFLMKYVYKENKEHDKYPLGDTSQLALYHFGTWPPKRHIWIYFATYR